MRLNRFYQCNFLYVHEPTSYLTPDLAGWKADFKCDVYDEKIKLAEDHGIVIYRDHDHTHAHRPDGIFTGVLKYMGWSKYIDETGEGIPFGYVVNLPEERTVEDIITELIEKIKSMGVEIEKITLTVGLGTFRPVSAETIEEHKMHSEYYSVSQQAADQINRALSQGRRVICVGTTGVRTLESAADSVGHVVAQSGDTAIFIYPGYQWKVVSNLITNFHLPESTLIMLVSALIGREKTLELYNLAVKENYRFFSFGDAMLILDE